jgi:hypothetical protein
LRKAPGFFLDGEFQASSILIDNIDRRILEEFGSIPIVGYETFEGELDNTTVFLDESPIPMSRKRRGHSLLIVGELEWMKIILFIIKHGRSSTQYMLMSAAYLKSRGAEGVVLACKTDPTKRANVTYKPRVITVRLGPMSTLMEEGAYSPPGKPLRCAVRDSREDELGEESEAVAEKVSEAAESAKSSEEGEGIEANCELGWDDEEDACERRVVFQAPPNGFWFSFGIDFVSESGGEGLWDECAELSRESEKG